MTQRILRLITVATAVVGISFSFADDSQSQANTSTAQSDSTLPTVVEKFEPTVVGYSDYYDPLENFNRSIFGFNNYIYRKILIPTSNGYVAIIPAPVQKGISGLFHNLKEPLFAINHLLQADFDSAGQNVARFLVNSTAGVLGIFDPASSWLHIERLDTTMSDTFIQFGFAQGPYLVIPVIGASDFRNAASRISDSALNPVRVITDNPETTSLILFDNFQLFAPSANSYIDLYEESADPYIYFRNQYLQGVKRDQEIRNGQQ